jgi:hypothetical protein
MPEEISNVEFRIADLIRSFTGNEAGAGQASVRDRSNPSVFIRVSSVVAVVPLGQERRFARSEHGRL